MKPAGPTRLLLRIRTFRRSSSSSANPRTVHSNSLLSGPRGIRCRTASAFRICWITSVGNTVWIEIGDPIAKFEPVLHHGRVFERIFLLERTYLLASGGVVVGRGALGIAQMVPAIGAELDAASHVGTHHAERVVEYVQQAGVIRILVVFGVELPIVR